ncbi:MAG TPA: cytochrome c peroxidase [Rhodothermales bacterium]|nr:cytochrome c peroxidase [Rhodothermales bacterium]
MLRLATLLGVAFAVVLAAFTVRVQSGVPVLPATPYNYAAVALPAHLNANGIRNLDNTPFDNPVTNAGATLGRVLFYDTRLSLNETISCGSCHQQSHGFSDPARFSTGFAGGLGTRNSMGLTFARYYDSGHFFWDERAQTLEIQTLGPVQDAVEMGMTVPEMVTRLQAASFYGPLFESAFGTPEVTADRVSAALAQFVRSIVAGGSRYDVARAQQGGGPPLPGGPPPSLPGFTAQENQGAALFFGRARCVACHQGELQVGDVPRNNGLDATITDAGAGNGRFKTGSLRNVELTAPYMHDGRFATLEAVVQHYDSGVRDSPNLDPILRQPLRLNLTAAERAALVAFLRTLTDRSVTTDPRWSDPFTVPTATGSAPSGTAAVALGLPTPNPVHGTTTFAVHLDAAADVTLDVFDTAGRRVATLVRGPLTAGDHAIRWDAAGLPAGRYLVLLQADGQQAVQAATVVR